MLNLSGRQLFATAIMSLGIAPTPAIFAEPLSPLDGDRPQVALVLSGGGALGLAHIGVLQVLEDMKVPVECIAGTSMGALVGGSYASGVTPQEMSEVISKTEIVNLFDDAPPRSEIGFNLKQNDYRPLFDFTLGFNDGAVELPSGASSGYKFELFLKQMIGTGASVSDMNFDELPTPYRAVATDLETGEAKVFRHGELPRVMRASMSLPAVVSPTVIDDNIYIDGGLARNLPVDVGRELCGDVIIAVNLGTRPKTRDQIKNSIDVALQSIVILTEQNVNNSLKELTERDILITPELTEFSSSSFEAQDEIIRRGVEAALASREQLLALSVSDQEYEQWLASRRDRIPPALVITDIDVETTGAVNPRAVLKDIDKKNKSYDLETVNRDIAEIYGRGDFSYVGYSLIPKNDDTTLLIKAESKPWGPGYLEFGLGAATDFNSPTQLNVAASYRRTWLNALGAEWRTDAQIGYDSFLTTEFRQPLQVRDGAFIAPYATVRRDAVQFYDEKIRLGEYLNERLEGGLDFGITGESGELRIGPYFGRIRSTPDFGALTPIIPENDVRQNGIQLTGIYDQLDSAAFPRSGISARLGARSALESWDSDDVYTRANVVVTGVQSFGKHTVSGRVEWGDVLSGVDDLPLYDAFKLGGPGRLSGLNLDQLTGSRYNLAGLGYYRQYATLPPQLGRGLYIGASLETGRINDKFMKDPDEWSTSGSVFWGADTILGAAYVGFGYSSLGQSTWYLVIGPQF